jgi:Stress responsive A/B Barrel Domain
MIRHFVALRFRKDVTAAEKAELYTALKDLSGHIQGVSDFKSFPNISVERPLVRDFNDGFWFDFKDESVRNLYLADPQHQAIGARIVASLEGGIDGVFVFDLEL